MQSVEAPNNPRARCHLSVRAKCVSPHHLGGGYPVAEFSRRVGNPFPERNRIAPEDEEIEYRLVVNAIDQRVGMAKAGLGAVAGGKATGMEVQGASLGQ